MSDAVWNHRGVLVKHLWTGMTECGACHRQSRNQLELAAMPCDRPDEAPTAIAGDDVDDEDPVRALWRMDNDARRSPPA